MTEFNLQPLSPPLRSRACDWKFSLITLLVLLVATPIVRWGPKIISLKKAPLSLSSLKFEGALEHMPGTGTKIRYLFLIINQNITPDKDSYPQANGSQHLLCDYIIPTCWMFVEGRHPSGLCRISVMWPRSRPWTPSIRKLMSLPLSFMLLLCKLASLPADMACSQWLSFTPTCGYPSTLWGLCRFPQDLGSSKS